MKELQFYLSILFIYFIIKKKKELRKRSRSFVLLGECRIYTKKEEGGGEKERSDLVVFCDEKHFFEIVSSTIHDA